MSGTRKLPRIAGIAGIMKKKIITTPCAVKILLYVSFSNIRPRGVTSSARISPAAMLPTKKKIETEMRYRIAMRLWSPVSSHDFRVWPASK